MKKCWNCDYPEMGDDDNYCVVCGIAKKGGVALCPICKHKIDPEKGEFCPNCGEYFMKGKTPVTNS